MEPLLAEHKRLGSVLGGTYRVERLIGQGGMGWVYEASHTRLPRRFAVKLLKPDVLDNRDIFARFQREAEIASSIGHKHIVQVFDFNHTEDGVPYMVLELLEGEDLAVRLSARGRLTLNETVSVLEPVASALDAAHACGVVHRDLKPQNLFLCRDEGGVDFLKILDFGVSKILGGSMSATRTGTFLGSPRYMSPEQADGRQNEVDHRTDVFALGTILFECLAGRPTFDAPSLPSVVHQICFEPHLPLRSLVPELPAAVEAVIDHALAKRRDDRPASAGELRDAFVHACRLAGPEPVRPPMAVTVSSVASVALDATVASADSGPPMVTTETGDAGDSVKVPRPRRVWRWLGASLVLLLFVTMAIVAGRGGDSRPPLPKPPTPRAAQASPAATVDPPVPPPTPTAVAVPMVELRLELAPTHARAELDGALFTQDALRVPQGSVHRLVVSAKGHVTDSRVVRAEKDLVLRVHLAPSVPKRPGRSAEDRKAMPGPLEDDL